MRGSSVTRTRERTRRVPRAMPVFALAPLVALSGCATAELWRGYAWPEPVVTEQLLERRANQTDGALVAAPPVLTTGLWWCEGEAVAPAGWWLCPKRGPGSDAEVAAALFAAADLCVVHSASIDATRRYVVGECVDKEATLQLEVRLLDGAIGQVVPAAGVSPAAAQVLATMRGNSYRLAVDPDTYLPAVYRRCAERL